MWFWKLSERQKCLRNANALLTVPLIVLFPFTFAAIVKPSVIIERFDIYGTCFLLPFLASAYYYRKAAKLKHEDDQAKETNPS